MATKKRTKKGSEEVETIVSIPDDVVLSPQAEAPRHLQGMEPPRARSRIRELSWAKFDHLVQGLARQIHSSFEMDAVVGVAHGGVFVGGAIASALGVEFFPVRVSRDAGRVREPKEDRDLPAGLAGRRVLIVDDLCASGETLRLVTEQVRGAKASEVRTATLVRKETGGFAPDWSAVTTDELVVFPWDYEPLAADGRFDVDPEKAGA